MTDTEDKGGPADKGGASGSSETPEKSASSGKQDAANKGGTPSTLEKAVAKVSNERKAEAEAAEKAKQGASAQKPGKDDAAKTGAPRRSGRGRLVGGLALVLLLVVAYLAWPVWGPMLPGSVQSSLAPVMGSGPAPEIDGKIAQFAARIEPLEKEISGLKEQFANRPAADPARLLALDDLVKQNGERLAALKAEIDSLAAGAGGEPGADGMAILTKRLEALEGRLVTLAARPAEASGPDASAALAALEELRTKSGERMEALERENAALRDIVAVLDKRVGAIEEKPDTVPGTARGNALVLAVGQLREAARGTAPFAAALEAVEALAESQEYLGVPLAVLKSHAATGVPDLIALRVEFDRIAGRIAHETFVPKGEGFVDKTLGQLSRIFTFRRTGTGAAAGDDENGRVARAELRLVAGDLEGAVVIMEGLQEPALSYAALWLKDARFRLQVDEAIKTLFAGALATARVPADGKGAPGG